jgi:hypothetical protein
MPIRTCLIATLTLFIVGASSTLCGATAGDTNDLFNLTFSVEDSVVSAQLRTTLHARHDRIVAFFDQPFLEEVSVQVCPDRQAFTASFPPEWGLEETQCWMVATGVADRLTILSPRVWREQACEHDPDDKQHVEGIVHHELVHVYHGQHNPTGDFTGAEELGWFLEGLAVYVSGQLEEGHVAPAREALDLGVTPEHLANAWSGKYRYGVCGSLVQYLDVTCGRKKLREMLVCTTQKELLDKAGMNEQELLAGWRDFLEKSE